MSVALPAAGEATTFFREGESISTPRGNNLVTCIATESQVKAMQVLSGGKTQDLTITPPVAPEKLQGLATTHFAIVDQDKKTVSLQPHYSVSTPRGEHQVTVYANGPQTYAQRSDQGLTIPLQIQTPVDPAKLSDLNNTHFAVVDQDKKTVSFEKKPSEPQPEQAKNPGAWTCLIA